MNSGNQNQKNKYNKMIQRYASQVNHKELRADITEWMETLSIEDFSSSFILTIVQKPGAREQRLLPQQYKNIASACYNSSRILAEVIEECGARQISTDIRNGRFYVTTENHTKITMVLD